MIVVLVNVVTTIAEVGVDAWVGVAGSVIIVVLVLVHVCVGSIGVGVVADVETIFLFSIDKKILVSAFFSKKYFNRCYIWLKYNPDTTSYLDS